MKILISFTLLLFSIAVTGQKFHTEFEYTDLINKGITIQNSYPKGGQKYTSANGKKYVFVVFWTCITNETDTDLELQIEFLTNSLIIPSSSNDSNNLYLPLEKNVIFNLYLPMEKMTLEKEPLLNYGLNIKSFLDENIDKPSKLIKKISPNDSHIFYTVAISNEGVNGPIRAGFELENKDLIYKINGNEIICGKITSL